MVWLSTHNFFFVMELLDLLPTHYIITPGTWSINKTFIILYPILNIPLRNITIIQQFNSVPMIR